MNEPVRFFSPRAQTTVGFNRVPHWDQQGRAYSLTFRLADSIPADLLREHRLEEAAWRVAHPEPWTDDTISLLTSVKQARASLGMSKACSAGAAGK